MCDEFDILSEQEKKEIENYVLKNMSPTVEQKMQNVYIGYIDINGMQYMMKTMPSKEFECLCNDIATLVESILYEHKSYAKEKTINHKIEFHMFSDNMIFLCDDLQFLIERLGLLQRRMVVQLKLTIKGCIDYGEIYYYKNRFVLGKGLVSAYKVDADYHNPAIQINRKLISSELWGVMKVAFDEYVIDYYRISAALSEDFWIEEIQCIKNFIEENLLRKDYTDDVVHKYLWMKDYHNIMCKKEGHCEFLIK